MNDFNNIKNDELNGQNNKNPFDIDNSYFEKLNFKIQNRIEEFEELSGLAPILSSIPKYNPFETPKGYFEELPTTIQGQVIDNGESISIKDWLVQIFQPRFWAPVLTVLIVAFTGIQYLNNTNTTQTNCDDYSLYEELERIDESTLIDQVVEQNTIETTSEDELVVEYLIENNIEELN
jgi:hypothetical protein